MVVVRILYFHTVVENVATHCVQPFGQIVLLYAFIVLRVVAIFCPPVLSLLPQCVLSTEECVLFYCLLLIPMTD